MTSLIFGSIYLAHKGATNAYRDKQRRKNYERWEGLRDEYDAQKKITRETRSLDIQRTGSVDQYDDRPIVSLRDLQEANDARTSWRPQESWETSTHDAPHIQPQPTTHHQSQPNSVLLGGDRERSGSTPSAYWQSRGELRPQKTGYAWDDGLPAPLRVTRRSFDDSEASPYRTSSPDSPGSSQSMQRQGSARSHLSSAQTSVQAQSAPADEPIAMNPFFIQQLTGAPAAADSVPMQPSFMNNLNNSTINTYPTQIPPVSHNPASHAPAPGGRMAELIERGY